MLTTPPPLFTDILQLEDNQNSLFCFKTRQPVYPHLALTALRWTYRLYPEPPELPESEPVFSVQKNRQFEDILLLSQIESGAHASLRDPHFGDNLFVIMTLEPLQGIREKARLSRIRDSRNNARRRDQALRRDHRTRATQAKILFCRDPGA